MSEFDEMQSVHTCSTLDLTFPLASKATPTLDDFLSGDIPELLHENTCSGLDLRHPLISKIEEEVSTVYEMPLRKAA